LLLEVKVQIRIQYTVDNHMAELPDNNVSDPESMNPDPDLDLGRLLSLDLDPFPGFVDPNSIRIRI
jgi:hypothetical protein